ncbi:hypothetical protein [Pseudodonghicola flavimaris]|uniref:DUF4760 domain-containing protein n=1 Tax=Pseudodonghicola flavimaris TaxID=3050036 RepID=A0ABT7F0G2_9RHOB|nr:hypothetical protein [Pseudodonghicola flavimaris]MDK3018085.1 hypothetical protein [Pseudodonghicola flavimaris]
MSDCGLHWTEYFKALGPTLIAIFVAYVAYQQWQVNRATLREKLFNRRFAVFKATQAFLSTVLKDGHVSNDALLGFHEPPQLARFLFDRELSDYLGNIRTKALEARMFARKAEADHNTDALEREAESLIWLNDQIPAIFEKFEPWLGFKKHR